MDKIEEDDVSHFAHTLLGLSILFLAPVIFHLIAFRTSKKFVHIMISILIGEFVLTVLMELFERLNLFDGRIVLLASILALSIIGKAMRKWKIEVPSQMVPKVAVSLTLAFAAFVLILQDYTPFGNDVLKYYLPLARILVTEKFIPPYYIDGFWAHFTGDMPLLYSHIALLFSIFNNYSVGIVQSIPVFYTSLTIFLLLNWAYEYGGKYAPYFTIISLFGVSPLFPFLSTQIIQEPPLLFFSTASFYTLFKYWKTKKNIFLLLTALSASLAGVSKPSGLLIYFIILSALLVRSRDRRGIYTVTAIFLLAYLPILLWNIKNLYYYADPYFPYSRSIFNQLFERHLEGVAPYLLSVTPIPSPPSGTLVQFTKDVFANFPAFLFAFVYMWRNKQDEEVKFVSVAFFMLFIIIAKGSGKVELIRYMFFGVGVLAIFAGLELSERYVNIRHRIPGRNKIIILILVFLFVSSFMRLYADFITHEEEYKYGADKGVLEYFTGLEEEGKIRVFVWGGYAHPGLIWYGDVTLISPQFPLFIALNGGRPFEFDRDSSYYYELLRRLEIDYVYDAPDYVYKDREDPLNEVISRIAADKKHFKLVYDKNGHRIWKRL